MYKVFIDGHEGTTGLRIYDRLSEFEGIELLLLSESDRKNPKARAEMINTSDISFLCLPDVAAKEAVSFVNNKRTKIIDTSTAHRTNSAFAYGFAELSAFHRENIISSKRVAVSGCHASGFIALVYPLIVAGVLDKTALLSCFSLTGYSGGGKKMIADYEATDKSKELFAPRPYGLSQMHKHLPEMQYITGLKNAPIFSPIVGDFYSGMVVSVPIFPAQLTKKLTGAELSEIYEAHYAGQPLITTLPYDGQNGAISANALSGKDSMQIKVWGCEDRFVLTSTFDNLGKGASGAAVQCMNLMLGFDETKGLCL